MTGMGHGLSNAELLKRMAAEEGCDLSDLDEEELKELEKELFSEEPLTEEEQRLLEGADSIARMVIDGCDTSTALMRVMGVDVGDQKRLSVKDPE